MKSEVRSQKSEVRSQKSELGWVRRQYLGFDFDATIRRNPSLDPR
jgi:hypothetical protein